MRLRQRLMAGSGPRRPGAAAAELAVLVVPLIFIALGCVDFGRFAYIYICVCNSARAGAAWGSVNPPSQSATFSAWQTSVTTAATNEWSSVSGFSSANLTVTVPQAPTQASPPRAEADVSYPFTPICTVALPGKLKLPGTISIGCKCVLPIIR